MQVQFLCHINFLLRFLRVIIRVAFGKISKGGKIKLRIIILIIILFIKDYGWR